MKLKKYFHQAKELAEQAAFLEEKPIEGEFSFQEFKQLPTGLKIIQLLQMIKEKAPEFLVKDEKLKKLFYDEKFLPINLEDYNFKKLIGRGGAAMVYLLESNKKENKSWVLKILRKRYLDYKTEDRHSIAKEMNEELEEVKSWYGKELEHIFLPEYIIESKGVKKEDTIIILQPFLSEELKDVFLDIDKNEWEELLKNNSGLKKDLKIFIDKTLKKEEETGEILDLAGRNNLSIILEGGECKLLMIDPHTPKSTRDKKINLDGTFMRIEQLKKIRSIIEKIDSKEVENAA